MKFHGKLLAFLAGWFSTVGVAFLLSNSEVFAGDCNECLFCEQYNYAAVITDGEVFIANGYFDLNGTSAPQAFDGGAVNDSSNWLYQAGDCHTSGSASGTGESLTINKYNNPNYTCTLPEGGSDGIQEFNGGAVAIPQKGLIAQESCSWGT